MKSERILYVILILTALGIGIYGYLSGLFTPHHYHAATAFHPYYPNYDSCKDEAEVRTVIYINQRENYLITAWTPHEKYKLVTPSETLNTYVYEDLIPFKEFATLAGYPEKEKGDVWVDDYMKERMLERHEGKMVPILYMAEHNKIDGGFKFWIKGSFSIKNYELDKDNELVSVPLTIEIPPRNPAVYNTCEITKQFLQRN